MKLTALASGLLISLCSAFAKPQASPNIIFFLVDDMGWQDTSLAFHSERTKLNEVYHTPTLERLATEGTLFTNAYACAICSPSRVSLMTGQNAARHKVTCWTLRKDKSPEPNHPHLAPSTWNVNGLQPIGAGVPNSVEATTLPEVLRSYGYRTIHVGKAHFGAMDTPGEDPVNLGFDVNIAGFAGGGPGSFHGDKNFSGKWRGADPIWDVPGLDKYHGQKINLTDAITREAISEIDRAVADEKPFYLYMAHYAVHAPWEDDRRFIEKYQGKGLPKQQATFASMLEGMDHSLSELINTLDRHGIQDETIIVFMSDNGSPQQCQRNLPLRGFKISAYEGGSRVPLVVKWPGVTKPNSRTDYPVIIEDLFPTILEMAGNPPTPNEHIDGHSIVPALKAPDTNHPDRSLFWHYPNYYNQPAFSSIRRGDWKLIYWHSDQSVDLFNLSQDLGEQHDISKQHPEIVNDLRSGLGKHLRSVDASMPILKASGKRVPYPDAPLAQD
ncbi:sulfatase [Sulfuriroseicoccus oceanibius]|uniref:Sulfatase n=1 Tax=Sulfuriroseicoccus oceanibius TaxID=2707525 RepID=A0A6B3LC47_9BACT|nr:sulfatase [Sulfuriroseicoccus oceanibius]QQL44532.1 sulfatase [Sulfuriroseicoccus oceanibius]